MGEGSLAQPLEFNSDDHGAHLDRDKNAYGSGIHAIRRHKSRKQEPSAARLIRSGPRTDSSSWVKTLPAQALRRATRLVGVSLLVGHSRRSSRQLRARPIEGSQTGAGSRAA